MNKEIEFLKIISNKLNDNSYLGDDCAYLGEYNLALSTDSLVEDVHFSLLYMTPYEIAKKALLVNISDILSSGAKADYALISLSGDLSEDFINDFYKGINEIANSYDIKIIGGDLTKGDKISINITILGDYKNRKISKRSNAKEGYVIAAAGVFGSSAMGLKQLSYNNNENNYFTNFHKCPKLYPIVSKTIATNTQKPYAMMDSSDGLVDCLYKISKASNAKLNVQYNLIPKKIYDRDLVLYGGEDYSLFVCLDSEDFRRINKILKAQNEDMLIQIGTVEKGKGIFVDNEKIEYKGFNHFVC